MQDTVLSRRPVSDMARLDIPVFKIDADKQWRKSAALKSFSSREFRAMIRSVCCGDALAKGVAEHC